MTKKSFSMIKKIWGYSFCMLICSCYSNKKIQSEQEKLANRNSTLLANYKNGIDFIAEGNDPEIWQLKMDLDKSIDFKIAEKLKISFTPTNPVIYSDGSEIYTTSSGTTKLRISILEKNSNRNTVEIYCNEKKYKGSGNYTINPTLHNHWKLEKIGNTNIVKSPKSIHQPSLQFDLIKNKIFGKIDQVEFSGNIHIKGNYIQFSSFSKNKKKTDKEFKHLLDSQIENHLLEYCFIENKLILILNDDSRLVFKKSR